LNQKFLGHDVGLTAVAKEAIARVWKPLSPSLRFGAT